MPKLQENLTKRQIILADAGKVPLIGETMLNLPNSITLTRIALVVVFTIAISVTPTYRVGFPIALIAFVLAAFSDWLDGYLARKLQEVTTFGKLIDPLADKIAVAAAFIYLTSVDTCPAWATILIVSREFLVTGIRQIAQEHGIIMAADRTGKWKTVFQLAFCTGVLLTLTVTAYPEGMAAFSWLSSLCEPGAWLYLLLLWGSIILTAWSGIAYCIGARKFLFRERSQP